ncbi:hypothetical protein J6590_051890, partial [Homalodisca vitripennis]
MLNHNDTADIRAADRITLIFNRKLALNGVFVFLQLRQLEIAERLMAHFKTRSCVCVKLALAACLQHGSFLAHMWKLQSASGP